jgi:hypothetical protein
MPISDLLIIRSSGPSLPAARPDRAKITGNRTSAGSGGVFVSLQGLISFPIASSLITTIWTITKAIFPANTYDLRGASVWVPVAVSTLIGLGIFLVTVRDEQAKPCSASQWLSAALIALVNSLLLLVAALGTSTLGQVMSANQPAPATTLR